MFCTKCGSHLPDHVKFCNCCGTLVARETAPGRQARPAIPGGFEAEPFQQPHGSVYEAQEGRERMPVPTVSDGKRLIWKWLGVASALLILVSGLLPMFRMRDHVVVEHSLIRTKGNFYQIHWGMFRESGDSVLEGFALTVLILLGLAVLLILVFQLCNHSLLSLLGSVPLCLVLLLYGYLIYGFRYGGEGASSYIVLDVGFYLMTFSVLLTLVCAVMARRKKQRR